MSIPIERRELEGGWVLTCRGKQGGDLRLSDISMDRENLLCYVLGSDENVLQPLANTLPRAAPVSMSTSFETDTDVVSVDDSVLEEVRELIVSAQQYNNWVVGVNGIKDVSIMLLQNNFYTAPSQILITDISISNTNNSSPHNFKEPRSPWMIFQCQTRSRRESICGKHLQ